MQESECGSTMVIYIPIDQYKHTVITWCNIIIHEYCITKGVEYDHKVLKKMKDTHELRKKTPRASQER